MHDPFVASAKVERGVFERSRKSGHSAAACCAVFAVSLILMIASPGRAIAGVAPEDLQAASSSLGFLDSLRRRSVISVGVVYSAAMPSGKEAAVQAAMQLSGMSGPHSSTIRANGVVAEELANDAQRFDVIYLMPSAIADAALINDYVRQHRVVSISSDPACLQVQCCVLMVHAGSSVDIVLDTALADAAGARFSAVFTMMVKRK